MRGTLNTLLVGALVALCASASSSAARSHLDNRDILETGDPLAAGWRPTASFSSLTSIGPDNFRFEQGQVARVRAEGDPRVLERLRFVVRDGHLYVGRKKSDAGNTRLPAATIYITAPAIRGATAAGSGRLSVARLSGDRVFATIAGSGEMTVDAIETRDVAANVAGSGSLALHGRTRAAAISVAGSGRFIGRDFVTGSASTSIAGSGNAQFRSSGAVAVSIVGSGTVTVTGGATCTLHKIGSGTLRCG